MGCERQLLGCANGNRVIELDSSKTLMPLIRLCRGRLYMSTSNRESGTEENFFGAIPCEAWRGYGDYCIPPPPIPPLPPPPAHMLLCPTPSVI